MLTTFISWKQTALVTALGLVSIIFIAKHFFVQSRRAKNKPKTIKLGIFHPYCCHGGGGERVLWTIVSCLLQYSCTDNDLEIIVYTGDSEYNQQQIFDIVQAQFGIELQNSDKRRVRFQNLRTRSLLEPQYYPVATMLFQSLAAIVVCLECLYREKCNVFLDTTGAAFGYPFIRVLGWPCRIIAYVHYPIISTDMLAAVRTQRPSYNNQSRISSSATSSKIKLVYYSLFARLYGLVGWFATTTIVNSSWTENHISQLWNLPKSRASDYDQSCVTTVPNKPNTSLRTLSKIYPPCDTSHLSSLPLGAGQRNRTVLSLGQFRPEKDHRLQIAAFKLFHDTYGDKVADVKLIMLGSSRNATDALLVDALRELTLQLGLGDVIDIVVNAPYSEVQRYLSESSLGLHTMWNEHFGISVVEMMAAGLLVIAHKSGGPLADIIVPSEGPGAVGYLAESVAEYADCIHSALSLCEEKDVSNSSGGERSMRERARNAAQTRFSEANFNKQIKELFEVELQRFGNF